MLQCSPNDGARHSETEGPSRLFSGDALNFDETDHLALEDVGKAESGSEYRDLEVKEGGLSTIPTQAQRSDRGEAMLRRYELAARRHSCARALPGQFARAADSVCRGRDYAPLNLFLTARSRIESETPEPSEEPVRYRESAF